MKYILTLGIVLITLNIHSQISTRYFFDGFETVEYVTLEICADSINGINNVKLISEKTNLKNQENINQLLNHVKNLDYPKDGPLIGKCGKLTFTLTNPEFEGLKINEAESHKCEQFRKGKYHYEHINHIDTRITRKSRIQKEISERGRQIYEVNWTSDCSYVLTYKRMSRKEYRILIGEKINVEIIKVLENDGYVYKAITHNGIDYFGTIIRSK